jgi:hypothetical protein
MIERDEQAKAWVSYLKHDFSPTTRDSAELVKVIYDNGKVVFGVPARSNMTKGIEDEPRDEHGRWTSGGPRVFYKGSNPGDERRISTGDDEWDSHFFVSSRREDAESYGKHIDTYTATPDAKILYHGTPEYKKMAKGLEKKSLFDHVRGVATRAKEAGYHAVHFERQGDVGTAIFDRSKFIKS